MAGRGATSRAVAGCGPASRPSTPSTPPCAPRRRAGWHHATIEPIWFFKARESGAGIEPARGGFAARCVPTSPPGRDGFRWCDRRDLHPLAPDPQTGRALNCVRPPREKRRKSVVYEDMVRMTGLEPATSRSQAGRSDSLELHPETTGAAKLPVNVDRCRVAVARRESCWSWWRFYAARKGAMQAHLDKFFRRWHATPDRAGGPGAPALAINGRSYAVTPAPSAACRQAHRADLCRGHRTAGEPQDARRVHAPHSGPRNKSGVTKLE